VPGYFSVPGNSIKSLNSRLVRNELNPSGMDERPLLMVGPGGDASAAGRDARPYGRRDVCRYSNDTAVAKQVDQGTRKGWFHSLSWFILLAHTVVGVIQPPSYDDFDDSAC
jgi:hypothetical protein